ncbi:MAG: enoyl-CoA hydratase-related protein [Polyangiales bacterium]
MYHTILYDLTTVEGGAIATIRLNRPERKNSIGPEMANEILYALENAEKEDHVRVVVLTGTGGTFCAGGDMGAMTAGPVVSTLPMRGDYADLILKMVRFTRPIIARVEGAAMGGGLGLVAASHFAIASETAVFATPEISRGLWPMMISAILARTVARRDLLEMMLVGAKMPAVEAARLRIINRAVLPDQLDDEVFTLAKSLALKSPTAVSRGLAAWAKQGDMALDAALPMLREELFSLLGTDDAREGLMAFMEKRAPKWTGK